MNPLHWFKAGQITTIRQSPLFDAQWYLHRYPDVALSGMDAAKHYCLYGADDLRDPGPRFSTSGYAALHNVAGQNPLLHCISNGTDETICIDGQQPENGPALLLVGHQAEAQIFGAERCLLHMLEQAASVGATVHALLPKIGNRDYMEQVLRRCHKLHVLPFGFRTANGPQPQTVEALQTLMQSLQLSAVHQNTLAPDAPLIAARDAGIPTLCHIRELPAEDPDLCVALEQSSDTLRSAILEQADWQVANSDAVARWINGPRTKKLPDTIEPDFFNVRFNPGARLRIGLIGNLIRKKGIEDLITVADQTDANFFLIGPATDNLTALGPLPDNVTHLGYIADAKTAVEQVDVVLSLSYFAESFGRTVYEGMAAGRPVICYDKGTPPDLLGADLRDLIVPAGNTKAVAQILKDLIASPELLHDKSNRARKRARALQDVSAKIDLSQIFFT